MKPLVFPFGLHAARHTFASLALAAGRSIRWVAEQLGHANPERGEARLRARFSSFEGSEGSIARGISRCGPADATAGYFGASCPQADLDALSAAERQHVEAGDVAPGMSRRAVSFAIGNPPLRATPRLEAPEWRYWRSRFRTMLVVFGSDGRVAEIER